MLKNRNIALAFKVMDLLEGHSFNDDEHQAIVTYLWGFYENYSEPDLNAFLSYLDDEKLRRIVVDIRMTPINDELSEQELKQDIRSIIKYSKLLQIKAKEAKLKEADKQKNIKKVKALLTEISNLRKEL